MIEPSFVAVIFFVTLGPMKTIPAFHRVAGAAPAAIRRRLALDATLFASVIAFAVALVLNSVIAHWNVSLQAIQIAGGLLLLLQSIALITQFSPPAASERQPSPLSATPSGADLKRLALSPLAVPAIVTPAGIVAILLFMDSAAKTPGMPATVLAILAGIMALDLLGMIAAHHIVGAIGLPVLGVVGWIFAVLQAGLAVQIMIGALRGLSALPPA